MTLLDVQNLRVTFETETGPVQAVRGVSFSLDRERLGIVGESGSGKTMTGRAVLRLIRPPGRIEADRMVFERDEGRCTFVGTGGHRCGSSMRLELHHIVPFALGGPDTPDNLTLHCGAHNRLVAEREGPFVRCVRAER